MRCDAVFAFCRDIVDATAEFACAFKPQIAHFAALRADTDVFTTFEGDNHVLLQLVAKGLLTDYSSDFEDLDQLGVDRVDRLAGRVATGGERRRRERSW